MKKEKFQEFWKESANWYNSVNDTPILKNASIDIRDYCRLRDDCGEELYQAYGRVKQIVKDLYFKQPQKKKLNKYKRAAVIAYIINISEPLEYFTCSFSYEDVFMLKQRLAIYMALLSIVIEYPKEAVQRLAKPLFDFANIGVDRKEDEDDFFTNICKDLYFSIPYENFNVLTMANMLQLLVERASNLAKIDPINDAEE